MTREEAIDYNKNLRMYMQITDKESEHKFLEENYVALDMAINALEREQKFLDAGYINGRVEFMIGGRKFMVKELAQ